MCKQLKRDCLNLKLTLGLLRNKVELNSHDVARSGRTPLLGREYTYDGRRALESQKQVLDEEGVPVSIRLKTHTPTDTHVLNKTK